MTEIIRFFLFFPKLLMVVAKRIDLASLSKKKIENWPPSQQTLGVRALEVVQGRGVNALGSAGWSLDRCGVLGVERQEF